MPALCACAVSASCHSLVLSVPASAACIGSVCDADRQLCCASCPARDVRRVLAVLGPTCDPGDLLYLLSFNTPGCAAQVQSAHDGQGRVGMSLPLGNPSTLRACAMAQAGRSPRAVPDSWLESFLVPPPPVARLRVMRACPSAGRSRASAMRPARARPALSGGCTLQALHGHALLAKPRARRAQPSTS